MRKLAIITTHPIQYNAPWFRLLAERKIIQIKVFYTWSQTELGTKFDPGFGEKIKWDIPLLEGYEYTFINNISEKPGSRRFKGIQNPTLIKEIKEWKPDAVLIFGWNFHSHLKCMRYFHNKIPVLFRGDSTQLKGKHGIRKTFRKFVLKWVYSHVDYSLYVGTENKKYFFTHGMKERQLIFVPHAVDNNRFAEPSRNYLPEIKNLKTKIGIEDNELVFLYAGKFEEIKNPQLIIEVAKKFIGYKIRFVLVGNGPLEFLLKDMAGENVSFLNFQNQKTMPVLYRLGDVFILPSRNETWGLSVNEAMACSRPVIVSDQCGCAVDLIKDGENGFVFKSGNLEDLAKKISEFLLHKDNITQMGKKSFEKIKDWSFERIAEPIESMVSSFNHI